MKTPAPISQCLVTLLLLGLQGARPTELVPARRLLQTDCPANQIIINGQCVCGQGYYNSLSSAHAIVGNLGYQCTYARSSINLAAT
jgi:hypothetical protein